MVCACSVLYASLVRRQRRAKIAVQKELYQALGALKPKVVIVGVGGPKIIDWSRFPSIKILNVDLPMTQSLSEAAIAAAPRRDDLAFIQFTSGSTGSGAKGVVVRHGQLADNIIGIGEKIKIERSDVMVSWAPLHHDMGLVALLLSLYFELPLVLIPTESFGRRPTLWLEAIDALQRHFISCASVCLSSSSRGGRRCGMESSIFPVGVTPGSAQSRFSRRNCQPSKRPIKTRDCATMCCRAPMGSPRRLSSCPTAKKPVGSRVSPLAIDSVVLRETGKVVLCDRSSPGALDVVGCGTPNRNMQVRIASDAGEAVGEGMRGRILIRGPSVTEGYFGRGEPRAADAWLDTGDLGFLLEGQIFIIGRTKRSCEARLPALGVAKAAGNQRMGRRADAWFEDRPRRTPFSYLRPEHNREEIVVLVEDRPVAARRWSGSCSRSSTPLRRRSAFKLTPCVSSALMYDSPNVERQAEAQRSAGAFLGGEIRQCRSLIRNSRPSASIWLVS